MCTRQDSFRVAYTKALQHEVSMPLLCLQRSHRSACEAGVPRWICLSAAITGRKWFLIWAIPETLCEATHRYWCLAVQTSVLPQSANFHPSRENRQLDLSLLSKYYFWNSLCLLLLMYWLKSTCCRVAFQFPSTTKLEKKPKQQTRRKFQWDTSKDKKGIAP